MKKARIVLAIAAVTFGLAVASAYAQDPVTVCPKNFKVLAEDDTARVLHFTQKKGEKCGMHSHPYIAAYVIKSGQLTYVMPDGSKARSQLKKGEALLRGPVTHAHEAAPMMPRRVRRRVQEVTTPDRSGLNPSRASAVGHSRQRCTRSRNRSSPISRQRSVNSDRRAPRHRRSPIRSVRGTSVRRVARRR
jgi:quercetin dioxygenase-like cupin family protein